MHIIIDTALNPGEAEYQNFGDVAMLQVAVSRLREIFPSAIIQVLTESPENLRRFCLGAISLPRVGKNLWVGESFLFGRLHSLFPQRMAGLLEKGSKFLRAKMAHNSQVCCGCKISLP